MQLQLNDLVTINNEEFVVTAWQLNPPIEYAENEIQMIKRNGEIIYNGT